MIFPAHHLALLHQLAGVVLGDDALEDLVHDGGQNLFHVIV